MYDTASILLVASLAASLWLVWRTNKLYKRIDSLEWLVLAMASKLDEVLDEE